jgi:hypothetical protein
MKKLVIVLIGLFLVIGFILIVKGGTKEIKDVYCIDSVGDTVATYVTDWDIHVDTLEKNLKKAYFVTTDGKGVVVCTTNGRIEIKKHGTDSLGTR